MQRIRLAMLCAATALVAACGGGNEPVAVVPPVVEVPKQVETPPVVVKPEAKTVLAYAASRAAPAPALTAAISLGAKAQTFDTSRAFAVSDLNRAVLVLRNAMSLPPLHFAHLELLRSAAAGDTLSEINRVAPAPADAAVITGLTSDVTRRVWGQTGAPFLTSWLSASDGSGSHPTVGPWLGYEIDFAALADLDDGAFKQSLISYGGALSLSGFAASALTRMLVDDNLDVPFAWPAVEVFDGVFVDSRHDRWAMPMVRLRDSVKLFRGSNYRADMVARGGLTLLVIRPDPQDPNEGHDVFARRHLDRALSDSLAAYGAGGPFVLTPGEIVLPAVAMGFSATRSGTSTLTFGNASPYNEITANLRALDGAGGTYAQRQRAATAVEVGATGLRVYGAELTAFTFSPANINGPGSSTGSSFDSGTFTFTFVTRPVCPSTEADTRGFFLALVNANRMLVSLASVAYAPAGNICN